MQRGLYIRESRIVPASNRWLQAPFLRLRRSIRVRRTRLQALTTRMQETSGIEGSPLTGISGGKRRKRVEMMERTVEITGDVHAFAAKNGDAKM